MLKCKRWLRVHTAGTTCRGHKKEQQITEIMTETTYCVLLKEYGKYTNILGLDNISEVI